MRRRILVLAATCMAALALLPLDQRAAGATLWLAALVLLLRDPEPTVRRRLGAVLGCVAILAVAPIHTERSTPHIVALGLPFLAVVVGPALLLRHSDPGVIRFRFWPRRLRWQDLAYTLASVPLSWAILHWYFFVVNPELPTHWPMPQPRTDEGLWRLFIGINAVGIWDELFFVNTIFALLRSVFPFRVANIGQAVIYTAVLSEMAFTGIGPILVYGFALTQGFMFEESENLLYVLVVHLVVDAFLVGAILAYHYPGFAPAWL